MGLFIPGALHWIEASFLADTSLRERRTAIFRAVWSGRQPLANTGAVLSLLDGPSGCDPAFCVVWFRFRMLRMYLAYRPGEVHRMYRLIDSAAEGCAGRGPAHLLVESAAEIVWREKALLRGVLAGGGWNGFLLVKVKGQHVPCRFCGGADDDVISSGSVLFLLWLRSVNTNEFHGLKEMDKSCWPRCLLWHGLSPLLSGCKRCFSLG